MAQEINLSLSYSEYVLRKLIYRTKLYLCVGQNAFELKFNLVTVQQDATYSVYYISVGSSTCFGC